MLQRGWSGQVATHRISRRLADQTNIDAGQQQSVGDSLPCFDRCLKCDVFNTYVSSLCLLFLRLYLWRRSFPTNTLNLPHTNKQKRTKYRLQLRSRSSIESPAFLHSLNKHCSLSKNWPVVPYTHVYIAHQDQPDTLHQSTVQATHNTQGQRWAHHPYLRLNQNFSHFNHYKRWRRDWYTCLIAPPHFTRRGSSSSMVWRSSCQWKRASLSLSIEYTGTRTQNWQDGHRIRWCVGTAYNLRSHRADNRLSLTNQPVVIDNVSYSTQGNDILMTCRRVPAISKLVSLERSNHRVIFLHCRLEAHAH